MANRSERMRRGRAARANVWPTFIALNIALFAFFAMMVSASEPDAPIAGAIVASVRQSFAGTPASADGDTLFAASRAALAELGGELRGTLRIVRISQPARGSDLRVSLPVSSLFEQEALEPGAAAMPLLDRIAAALSAPPPGLRLSAMLTLPDEVAELATTTESSVGLPRGARRAAALAGALAARGAPPAALAAGIGRSADDDALIVFRFQPAEERRRP